MVLNPELQRIQACLQTLLKDVQLTFSRLVKFYSLRFQIEFTLRVRDAKQYWGLEDFMNVKDGFAAVTNAINQAFFMVNFSAALLQPYRQRNPDYCFESFRTASLT
jgi:putative transposase